MLRFVLKWRSGRTTTYKTTRVHSSSTLKSSFPQRRFLHSTFPEVNTYPYSFPKNMSHQHNIHVGELLSVCMDAAQKAGEIITKIWKSGELDIKEKGVDDPFTKADIQAQQLIMGLLQKKWPELSMIGEEAIEIPQLALEPRTTLVDLNAVPKEYHNVPLQDLCVFVDPLDATREYTLGLLQAVTSLVGISLRGEAIAGVIYQPFLGKGKGRLVWGMKGLGAFGYQEKEKEKEKEGIVAATTRAHSSAEGEKAIARLGASEVLRVGGAGYKALLVLEGEADVYLFATPGTKKWDTCAPEAIVRAAGGTLTDIQGQVIPYFKHSEVHNLQGVLCSLSNHQHYLQLLQQSTTLEGERGSAL